LKEELALTNVQILAMQNVGFWKIQLGKITNDFKPNFLGQQRRDLVII
jgi:hypothetical protein